MLDVVCATDADVSAARAGVPDAVWRGASGMGTLPERPASLFGQPNGGLVGLAMDGLGQAASCGVILRSAGGETLAVWRAGLGGLGPGKVGRHSSARRRERHSVFGAELQAAGGGLLALPLAQAAKNTGVRGSHWKDRVAAWLGLWRWRGVARSAMPCGRAAGEECYKVVAPGQGAAVGGASAWRSGAAQWTWHRGDCGR